MKFTQIGLVGLLLGMIAAAQGQVVLSGTTYTENFNNLAVGLPTGWSVYTSATTTTLGTSAIFQNSATAWNASLTTETANFRNIAGNTSATDANGAAQLTNADRALGWRPGTAASRNGAIAVALSDTLGFENFSLSITLFSPVNVSFDQTYDLEYRIGSSGSFTRLASTYSTGTIFGTSTLTANSVTLSALNNQSSGVIFRVRGTTATGTESGGLDVLGIDNFTLNYSATAIPEPAVTTAALGLSALLLAVVYRRRVSALRLHTGAAG